MKYGSKAFEQNVFICQCMSDEHQFVFTFDPDNEDVEYQECYLDVHLNPGRRGFWKRLWYGLKYAFGHRSKYGNWDSTIVCVEDARKLRDLLDKFVKFCETKDGSAATESVPPLVPSK
jgi:hypothetical protein